MLVQKLTILFSSHTKRNNFAVIKVKKWIIPMVICHFVTAIPLLTTSTIAFFGQNAANAIDIATRMYANVQLLTERYRCGVMDISSKFFMLFFVMTFLELIFYSFGLFYLSAMTFRQWKAMKNVSNNAKKNVKLDRQLIRAIVIQVTRWECNYIP